MVTTPIDFSSLTDRISPQNLDAEEAILGGILLDPEALARIAESLPPEAFFLEIHQQIYRAALALHAQGQPADLMTVTMWLHDRGQLERVGGQGKLAQLVESTVSAVNIDRYAALVMDKHLRRQIIHTGHEIAQLGHEQWTSQEALFKQIENKLLGKKGLLSGLKTEKQRSQSRYEKMVAAVERVEMTIENPGLKVWEYQRLASEFGISRRALEDIWYRHLIFTGEVKRETWSDLVKDVSEYREWLLHGFLPKEGLVLLHAEGGTGKTRLFYDWAFCLTFGEPWNDLFAVTSANRKVLLVQTDELTSEMYEALETRGFNKNPNVEFIKAWDINNIAALNRHIEEFDPDVVFVDSLNSVSTNSLITENDAEFARPILALRKLSEAKGKLIFLTHHSNKTGDVRGSTAIKAACSLEMRLSRDPQFPQVDSLRRILTLGKTRSYRRPAEYALDFDPETGRWIWLGEASKQETGDVELPLKEKIVRFLAANRNQRFEYEELHREVGGSLHSVRRAACQLAGDAIINRVREPNSRRSLFFLPWHGETIDMINSSDVIIDDHIDDHNGNAHGERDSESHDHVIMKSTIVDAIANDPQNSRSHDHKAEPEPQNPLPEGDSSYDRSYDRSTIALRSAETFRNDSTPCDEGDSSYDRVYDHGEDHLNPGLTYRSKCNPGWHFCYKPYPERSQESFWLEGPNAGRGFVLEPNTPCEKSECLAWEKRLNTVCVVQMAWKNQRTVRVPGHKSHTARAEDLEFDHSLINRQQT